MAGLVEVNGFEDFGDLSLGLCSVLDHGVEPLDEFFSGERAVVVLVELLEGLLYLQVLGVGGHLVGDEGEQRLLEGVAGLKVGSRAGT